MKQIHVRMYQNNGKDGYSVHAHIEYIPEKAPVRHILGYNSISGCYTFFLLWGE